MIQKSRRKTTVIGSIVVITFALYIYSSQGYPSAPPGKIVEDRVKIHFSHMEKEF